MAESLREHVEELEPSQFCCSVCLDLLKDPVGIPCGHSYCKGCIEGFWDQNEEKGNCTCPQCRETFSPRPVLRRNHMLAEVVEMLKRKDTQQTPPSLPEEAAAAAAGASSGRAGVVCDFCTELDPRKATMSCLTCMISYCPDHLAPHYSVPALKKHQLVSTTVPLQEKMCTKHNKLMEVYCRTDKKCICYLCVIDEHHGHQTVSTAAEREEQQKQLTVNQKEVQERENERGEKLTELLEALKVFKKSSQTAVETSNSIFDELVSSFTERCTLTKQQILAQEKVAVAQAEVLQLELEEEITRLKQRDSELEQISHVDDHIHFIQTFQSLSPSGESPNPHFGLVVRSKHTFKPVTDCLSKLRDDVEGLLKQTWPSVTSTVSAVNVLKQPEPETREEFLHYSCPLKLDQRAVSQNMALSKEHQRATCRRQQRCFYDSFRCVISDVTERITEKEQMWCCEALTQRCYWEVSFTGSTWSVGVSYKNQSSSFNSEFGLDNRSWSLECSRSRCSFRHNNQSSKVSGKSYSKIGVYLDYSEDTLTFYSIANSKMTLLHRVEHTFTEPLYPCIGFKEDGSNKESAYHAEFIKIW